ncbi:hypothetical protein CSHOW_1196 [Campylobacter showae]|uniref:Uncharacterized protein n=1 Tax=Campylobacter showae RM3277 TaxID=553219 RepID=C6RDE0_9BACT|nr:hypothetical protein [Campylobacter showae]EET80707.1 hypothetical protein CAMSH0001_1856 [Campylobacter showae RM3277]QCD49121.1 hypothetical protein CSHOW_1196 [Campylobacter showae]
MISGVNGLNANVNYDFSSSHGQNLKTHEEKETANQALNLTIAQPNLTAHIDYDALDPEKLDRDQLKIWAENVDPGKLTGKNLSKWLGIKMGFEKFEDSWRKELGLNPNEPVAIRRIFSLSGYTKDDKISVWGKINGLDPSIDKEKATELKKFIDSTKALAANEGLAGYKNLNVDDVRTDLGGVGTGFMPGFVMLREVTDLLDSDMDIDKFKDKWLEFAAEKILGDHASVKISLKDGKLNFDQTPEKVRLRSLNQSLEKRVSYADEATKKEFLNFLKDAFNKGESIGDVLQNIALKESAVSDQTPKETPEENKFKPIQAVSKSQTYVYKDIKREFFENFLTAEREKGTDITEILNQLAKLGKFDVKA